MEQNNLPIIAKRLWSIVRVVYYMLRKGISKRKLLVDLNVILKRGKLAGKAAIGNLLHHHVTAAAVGPREYEFSCSNTPNYTFPSFKRRHGAGGGKNLFACSHAPPTQEEDLVTMNAVKVVLEMLNGGSEVVSVCDSPALPGFGRSTAPVRQLRITDSPFPAREFDEGDNGIVDKAAEAFIDKFYKELKNQRRVHGY